MRPFTPGLVALSFLCASTSLGRAAEPVAPPAAGDTCDALCGLQRYFTADRAATQEPAAAGEPSRTQPEGAVSPAEKVARPAPPAIQVAEPKPAPDVRPGKKAVRHGGVAHAPSARLATAPLAREPRLIRPGTPRFASIIPGGAPTVGARFMALRSDPPAR